MNKQEYMAKLSEALNDFDSDVKDEIINDYEEHFSEGLSNGKSEDEIVSELGSIEELVKELKDYKGENTTNAKKENNEKNVNSEFTINTEEIGKAFGEIAKGFATLLGGIAGTITKGAETVGENVASGAGSFADSLTKGLGEVGDKVVKTTTAFADDVVGSYKATRGESSEKKATEEEEEVESSSATGSDCKAIVVETDCGDIEVNPSRDGQIHVEYNNYGSANQKLAYGFNSYTKDNTFYVIAKRKPGTSNFFRSLSNPEIKLDIVIPDGLEKVDLSTASGDVDVNDINTKDLVIKNVSGDIEVREGVFGTVSTNNVSGDSNFDSVDVVKITANSVSGDINVEGSAEEAVLNNTSGDIELRTVATRNVSGNSVSGDINLELDECSGISVNTSSLSGDTNIEWHEGSAVTAKKGLHTFGDGSTKIRLNTVSGDMNINA